MRYLYGVSDTKYLTGENRRRRELSSLSTEHKYKPNAITDSRCPFDHDALPIVFCVQPASLTEQAVNAVDKLPLSSVFDWTNAEVTQWIRSYGYPQYVVNMVSGRKLLLIDAAALSAMNIKDFKHIKHITYGIRMLFHLQLAKYSGRISLPDEHPNELYMLWHTQTGVHYDAVHRSDLFRRMQLIGERELNLDHWTLLMLWLKRERERKYKKLANKRSVLAKVSSSAKFASKVVSMEEYICNVCIPPCECLWDAAHVRWPWRLSCIRGPASIRSSKASWMDTESFCKQCIPPCECRWLSRFYLTDTVLMCLRQNFPEKFSPIYDESTSTGTRDSLIERWFRFSI
ncbi:uncharacterized protein LOC111605473 isoform X3 [Drosophila hydei]|uniref:Uncharacterized protein LOC111605473 isoform X3 n=1 Tax=Drosophila hydei TaxID=7224 RepID=A0A6J1ME62_DROHY|nr:uncharacterized protein LOC111605473 isoform X3 [Drosophila hydei]